MSHRRSSEEVMEPVTLVFDATDAPTLGLPAPTSPINKTSNGTPLYIGDYRIVRKLGEGGMGVVYKAEQQHPRRRVTLMVWSAVSDGEAPVRRARQGSR